MFSSSSQQKNWMFSGETELARYRTEANKAYIEAYCQEKGNITEEEAAKLFLTPAEERILGRQYEVVLRKLCSEFQPPMPKCVVGTSLAYFKRFYVHNSTMDYHPKDIMLTCVYLACKVEEFYVPIGQFVKNLRGDREKFADAILSFELTLMGKLNYQLTIHNPFRPMEGFMIDLKTRYKSLQNPEKIRKASEDYLDRTLLSDACLIFSPSQIALASLKFGAAKEGISLDSYIKGVILQTATEKETENTLYQLKRLKAIVKGFEPTTREQAQGVHKKLERCRNQENNPDSEIYKQKAIDLLNEEDDAPIIKRPKVSLPEDK